MKHSSGVAAFAIPLSFTTASCHTASGLTINHLGTNASGIISADVGGGFTGGVRRTDVIASLLDACGGGLRTANHCFSKKTCQTPGKRKKKRLFTEPNLKFLTVIIISCERAAPFKVSQVSPNPGADSAPFIKNMKPPPFGGTTKSSANDKFLQGPPRILPPIRHFPLINYFLKQMIH